MRSRGTIVTDFSGVGCYLASFPVEVTSNAKICTERSVTVNFLVFGQALVRVSVWVTVRAAEQLLVRALVPVP